MSKVIRTNAIIGNFLLAAAEKGIYQIRITELFKFDRLLSPNLNRLDYFTCLCYTDILDFMDTYPGNL